MNNFKIKETYLLFLIVIGLISLAGYSTYALFTASTEIEDVVEFSTSLSTNNSIVEYEMVTVPAGETKIIELNITNSYGSSLYYGAWYEMVSPSTINDDIEIGLYTDEDNTPSSGTITSGTSLSLLVGITNNTSSDVIINIGTVGSLTNSLGLADTRVLIPTGWTEALIVTDEVLAQYTGTKTETTTTTKDYSWLSTSSISTSGKATLTLNPGTYKLEVWGAQGGNGYNNATTYAGGKGGYSYGTLTLTKETTAYVYVGGQGTAGGTTSSVKTGGYNGGGNSGYYRAGSGGGASDIRLGTDSLYARVIVAGGGGGGAYYSAYYGGAGGGASGVNGTGRSSSTTYWAGGGSISAGGKAGGYSGYTGTAGSFGQGGAANNSSSTNNYRRAGGGGGGWFGGGGGGYRKSSSYYYYGTSGGGGGSGWVYTSGNSSYTSSTYTGGTWLLNSSYYLTNAATVAGNTSFTDFSGSTVTGHSGNGAAKITGTEKIETQVQVTTYSIPRVVGINTLNVTLGNTADLTSGVSVECAEGQTGCSLVSTPNLDTSTLAEGTYTVYYTVKDANNKKYKYLRKVRVSDTTPVIFTVSNILVNNTTFQGIPTTGLYSLNSNNCSNISYDRFTKKVKISDFTANQSCDLKFTSDTNYPLLNTMKVGDYVAYSGDPSNGCLLGASGTTGNGAISSGNSCLGYNANQPDDGSADSQGAYGYCTSFQRHYQTYGWRIAYINDNKVHLVSAGSPECRHQIDGSSYNAAMINDLNTEALKYCNKKYVDGGTCPTTASETASVRALGNDDFAEIIYSFNDPSSIGGGGIIGLSSGYWSNNCYNLTAYKKCGYGNDLIDNGGDYWFAAHNGSSTSNLQWDANSSKVVNAAPAGSSFGLRPIIRLSSSVYVTGGAGTMDDPYTIGI